MASINDHNEGKDAYLYESSLDKQLGEDEDTYLRRLWLLRRNLLKEHVDVDSFLFPNPYEETDGHVRDFLLWKINERTDLVDKALDEHRFPAISFYNLKKLYKKRFKDYPPTPEEICVWVSIDEITAYKKKTLTLPHPIEERFKFGLAAALNKAYFDRLEVSLFDPLSAQSQGRWLTYQQLLKRWEWTGSTKDELDELIRDCHDSFENSCQIIADPVLNPEELFAFHPKTYIANNYKEGLYRLKQVIAFEEGYFGSAPTNMKTTTLVGQKSFTIEPSKSVATKNQQFIFNDNLSGRGDFGTCIRHRLVEFASENCGRAPNDSTELWHYMKTRPCAQHDLNYDKSKKVLVCDDKEKNKAAFNQQYKRLGIR